MVRRAALTRSTGWQEIADLQCGLVALRQLTDLGLTPDQARQWARTHRWVTVAPGVYRVHGGPMDELSRVWQILLRIGPDAAASHRTALWLYGVVDEPSRVVHVTVPGHRYLRPTSGVRVHRSSTLTVHPTLLPPRVRLESSVLDACGDTTSTLTVIDLVCRAVQRRLTTPDRLRATLASRPRQRWRSLLAEVLAETGEGATTPLELRYLRDVERRHALPGSERNRPERTDAGHLYRDARYRPWGVVVELDGSAAHPPEGAFRDRRRDNRATRRREWTLRYGWHEVASHAWGVAAEVAQVLRDRGWLGAVRSCSPACTATVAGAQPHGA